MGEVSKYEVEVFVYVGGWLCDVFVVGGVVRCGWVWVGGVLGGVVG